MLDRKRQAISKSSAGRS